MDSTGTDAPNAVIGIGNTVKIGSDCTNEADTAGEDQKQTACRGFMHFLIGHTATIL
jgi:hypothetical protein